MMMRIGPIEVATPVELAPMAGVTNAPFRMLCRNWAARGWSEAINATGAFPADEPVDSRRHTHTGLFVAEMVTSRALVERTPESMRIVTHGHGEALRSVQLYGVDPVTVGQAVSLLVEEDLADHIDLNFGCPVPKVTRKGGGAALPWKIALFEGIVTEAVGRAGDVPVTIKMRVGIDDDHITYIEAAQRARDAGVAAIALHARTAAQHYAGQAQWEHIATLKQTITDIPILGNGDIWSAADARMMMDQTGCDGVVIGRGCQGRPWLFADLVAALNGHDFRVEPSLSQVAEVIVEHADLMCEFFGEEHRAMREMRKHMGWYFKGYPVGGSARRELALIDSRAELVERLGALDLDEPYPGEGAEGPRGRAGTPKVPVLPQGWLDSRALDSDQAGQLHHAELDTSGG